MDTEDDVVQEAMKKATNLIRNCVSEYGRISPKVAAVAVKDGKILDTAFRGEKEAGDHAEFILLEKKLTDHQLAGATLITTLEPCTVRGASKIPCAERIIRRGFRRVLIGTLDPNPVIRGQGQLALERQGLTVEMFPEPLKQAIRKENELFEALFLSQPKTPEPLDDYITRYRSRQLDDWYLVINRIYWDRNAERDASVIFLHLVELVGGLSGAISNKLKPGVNITQHLAKSIGWWLALSGRLGVRSVQELLWDKYPGICPYCQLPEHSDPKCRIVKKKDPGPDWRELEMKGRTVTQPKSIAQWQRMFGTIYPASQMEQMDLCFTRLIEELGELAEAVRISAAVPGYFLSEAADVFAWLMKLQNILEMNLPDEQQGLALSDALCREYPERCRYCDKRMCSCPSILPGSVGRITHEVPRHRGSYGNSGRFITPDLARVLFRGGIPD
jgi:pyrimidine deaminase RibD-like protein/NTP pyrophosphatase (non-canonical NTP hydrolase)